MVMRIFTLIALATQLFITSHLWASSGESSIPKSYKVGSIRQIIIEENGAWSQTLSSSDETANTCQKFILTEPDIVQYFNIATRIDKTLYNYLSFSRCYASGKIIFKNGDKGRWFIDAERRGHLVLDNGQHAYFYGIKAQATVFSEPNFQYNELFGGDFPVHQSKIKMGVIKKITFRNSELKWLQSEEQKSGQCHFELNENDVRNFFQHAQVVTQKTLRQIPSSRCHVEGDLEFVDGRRGSWMIESSRRGTIQFATGGTLFFYGKEAQAEVFDRP